MRKTQFPLLAALLHTGALLPLFLLVFDFAVGRLTANPIREIQLRTGSYTLFLLTLSLACTPVYVLTGMKRVLDFRRPFGLYAFMYGCLHLMNILVLDYFFDLSLLWLDIGEKPYILVGLPAFVILLVLAITSTRTQIRRLGMNWKRLHRLVYVAGILGVVHYYWQVRTAVPAPFIYGGVLAILLLLRVPALDKFAAGHLPWRKTGDKSS